MVGWGLVAAHISAGRRARGAVAVAGRRTESRVEKFSASNVGAVLQPPVGRQRRPLNAATKKTSIFWKRIFQDFQTLLIVYNFSWLPNFPKKKLYMLK